MSRFVRIGLLGVLSLSICLAASRATRGDDEDEKVEKQNIEDAKKVADQLKKLVDAVESGKGVAEAAKALNDKGPLKSIMWAAFKPRDKGGFGLGAKPGTIKPDGVEAKLINMARRPMAAADLTKESADLVKMAKVADALGDIAELNTPKKNDPKDPKKTVIAWKKYTDQEKKGAKELEDALKSGDPMNVNTAAKNLYASCTSCHSDFRD